MIFIIGGAYQGKTAYAQEYMRTHCHESYTLFNHYHLKVREQLKEGADPMKEAKKLLEEGGEGLLIISDEVGYGLVPTDAFEREYREQSGRVNCFFAAQAEQVIRIVSGIGMRLK
ncbi:MAG: bifunctional adenosylcobinamide kinase/adenosylcobinamide-phosphate guanylyltransferase [Lachnospiraceae bacterium]|nr:bifunctional adenosylcobinamide kinase/adenosylcobinamide-phosphate guanylyltransferase [Lachnospiraceae bacterium]